MESLFLLREDIDQHTSIPIPLTKNIFEQRVCDQNSTLCCDFMLNMSFSNYSLKEVRYIIAKIVMMIINIVKYFSEILQISSCGLQSQQNSSWHRYRNCYNLLYRSLHWRQCFKLWLSLSKNFWNKRCSNISKNFDFGHISTLAKWLLYTKRSWHIYNAPKSIRIFIFSSWSRKIRKVYWYSAESETVKFIKLWNNWSTVYNLINKFCFLTTITYFFSINLLLVFQNQLRKTWQKSIQFQLIKLRE
jgi:hypothetical protein